MVMVAMMKSGNVQLQQIGATKKNKFGNLNLAFIFCQNNTLLYRRTTQEEQAKAF